MGHQPQDTRVERASSRWWRAPVASACLKTMVMTGLAGVAWLIGGTSAAHADIIDLAGALGSGESVVSDVTELVTPIPAVRSADRIGMPDELIDRPLVAVADQVPQTVTATVPSLVESTGGALTPATTPVSGAVDGLRAIVEKTTPALVSTVAVGTTGVGRLASAASAGSAGTGILPDPHELITPVSTGATSASTGIQSVDATSLPRAVRSGSARSARIAPAARTADGRSRPTVGATSAPTLPAPAPAHAPGAPGAGMHSGSSAASLSPQLDGSTGVIGAGGHAAALLVLRGRHAAAEAGVPLTRAEELAATPD